MYIYVHMYFPKISFELPKLIWLQNLIVLENVILLVFNINILIDVYLEW